MQRNAINALIVESDRSRSDLLASLLSFPEGEPWVSCECVTTLAEGNRACSEGNRHVVFTALDLSDATGLDALASFQSHRETVSVIAVLEAGVSPGLVEAARSLSDDCLFWHELSRDAVVRALEDGRKPVLEGESTVEVAARSSGRRAASGKALVVDDEEVLRMVLRSILENCGFEPLLAEDGEEAMRLFEENKGELSIALVDLNLPGLSGREVYSRMRSEGTALPILVMSGDDDLNALPFQNPEAENSAFVMKPFGMQGIREAVEGLLGVACGLSSEGV